jgi:hypothetical protein
MLILIDIEREVCQLANQFHGELTDIILPEDDSLIFRCDIHSSSFAKHYNVPSFQQWLDTQADMRSTYPYTFFFFFFFFDRISRTNSTRYSYNTCNLLAVTRYPLGATTTAGY